MEEFRARIERALAEWAWFVAEIGDRPAGYAYATPHRSRGAYKWSVEPSVYVDPGHHRCGVGTKLYATLLPHLAGLRYCNAYAGITFPNNASVGLHQRLGFEAVGTFRSVGFKLGAWHDVSWWHLGLRSGGPPGAAGCLRS